jgi:hypothetical protein
MAKTPKRPDRQEPSIERIEAVGRIEFRLRIADWLGRIALAVVITGGVRACEPVVRDLAGQNTNIGFAGQLGWGATAVASLGWAQSGRRRRQLAETLRLHQGSVGSLTSGKSGDEEEAS